MRASEMFRRRSSGAPYAGPAMVVMPVGASDIAAVAAVVERLGFRAEVYHDAGTALDTIEYKRPALVVHSYELPDMDGATFHGAVQKRAGGRRIPTLAIMPAEQTPDQHFGAQTGIMEYICRPFEADALASRLQGLLPHVGEEIQDASAPNATPEPPAARAPRPAARLDPSPPPREEAPTRKAPRREAPPREVPARDAPPRRVEPVPPPKDVVTRRTAGEAPPAGSGGDLRLRVIGLGEWGIRGAERLAARGVTARAVDLEAGVLRAQVPAARRHRIALSSGVAAGAAAGAASNYGAATQALAADRALSEALAGDADGDLIVVVANLGQGAGALLATLLKQLEAAAPGVPRLAIARLPGLRSGPDERTLGLVALNAVLQGSPSSILLVQHPAGGGSREADDDSLAVLDRVYDLCALAGSASGAPVQGLGTAALVRVLGTPGFLGWREMPLTAADCGPEARPWHEQVGEEHTRWQPEGFAWGEAQALLPLAQAPRAWLDAGGRRQYDRFVQEAWDEAAPCAVSPALYADEPARAVVISAGLPYPRGVLALRDSVEADRTRLAAKRRAAETLIPLGDDFLSSDATGLLRPAAGWSAGGPPPDRLSVEESRHASVVEDKVADAWEAPRVDEPPVRPAGGPTVRPADWLDFGVTREPSRGAPPAAPADSARSREPSLDGPPIVPPPDAAAEDEAQGAGPMPPAYEAALVLARRIVNTRDLRADIDLGDVRYALYDLLEVLREQPELLLPEVFRPSPSDYVERHHVNVAVLAILTGDLLKGSLSEVIDLGIAAFLHDIGMLETRATWDIAVQLPPKVFDRAIRPHPELGFRLLQEIPGMTAPVARMVLEEHERMDGTGYPEGLAGDAIDPGARILAVCDTLEALTHPRPFRDHLTPVEALTRLQILGQYTLDSAIVTALTDELGGLLRNLRTTSAG